MSEEGSLDDAGIDPVAPEREPFRLPVDVERLFLGRAGFVLKAYALVDNIQNCCEGEEPIPFALRTAINKTCERHPLLRTRIELNESGAGFFVNDVAECPLLVREIDDLSEDNVLSNVIDVCEAFDKDSMNVFEDPLTRFALLLGPEFSVVLIYSHHAVCDGYSLSFVMNDFFSFLSDKSKEVVPVNPPRTQALRRRSKQNIFVRMYFAVQNARWRSHKIQIPRETFLSVWETLYKTRDNAIEIRLSEQDTNLLREVCRSHRVSVHCFLLSILCWARAHNNWKNPKMQSSKTTFAVSLRKYYGEEYSECCGMLAALAQISFNYRDDKSIWSESKRMKRTAYWALRNFKNYIRPHEFAFLIDHHLRDAMIMNLSGLCDNPIAASLAQRMKDAVPSLVFTNLGLVSEPHSDYNNSLHIRDVGALAPAAVHNFCFVVCSATFLNRLRFFFPFNECGFEREEVEGYAKLVHDRIVQLFHERGDAGEEET